MASAESIYANVGALFGSFGRELTEPILESYGSVLDGDQCTDYQLARGVRELMQQPGRDWVPSAGVVRDAARRQPRDAGAAENRLAIEQRGSVMRGGKYEPLPHTPQLKDATEVEGFDFEAEMEMAGFDVDSMRRRRRGGGALQRVAREYDAKTFSQRQADYRRIVSQLDK